MTRPSVSPATPLLPPRSHWPPRLPSPRPADRLIAVMVVERDVDDGDLVGRVGVEKLAAHAASKTGTGVLVVEQHLNLVRRTTQRFVVMAKGEIIDRGLTADIDSEKHRAALAF